MDKGEGSCDVGYYTSRHQVEAYGQRGYDDYMM
jgi:hypothetical protein